MVYQPIFSAWFLNAKFIYSEYLNVENDHFEVFDIKDNFQGFVGFELKVSLT